MMDRNKRGEYVGALGTVVAHAALLALLIFISFSVPIDSEDGGVPVIMGDVETAQEGGDNSLVDVDVLPEPEFSEPAVSNVADVPLITQEQEKTVDVPTQKTKVEKVKPKSETVAKTKTEKSEAEIEAERKRLAEEKAAAERKAAAEAAAKRVSGAFGKGSQMSDSRGTSDSGKGAEGSKNGNSTTGVTTGTPGYGTFNLGGRSLGEGGLPRPVYNVQEEGVVAVSIVVSPAGKVIDAKIDLTQTKTVSTSLRKAALDAAKKARFNEVTGVNNQSGTITYYFRLK